MFLEIKFLAKNLVMHINILKTRLLVQFIDTLQINLTTILHLHLKLSL